MGGDSSKPVDAWDALEELGIVPNPSTLTLEEANKIWDETKKADAAQATRDEMKLLFDGVARIFTRKLEEDHKAKFETKEATFPKEKDKAKFRKRRELIRAAVEAQFSSQKTITYFCRAARASEKGCPKEAFLTTVTAGGQWIRKGGQDEFKWANYNKAPEAAKMSSLTLEQKEKIRRDEAQARGDEKKMDKTASAQASLLRSKQALFGRDEKDDLADKNAKDLRAALADRTKDLFKKCSADGKSLKPPELKSLVHLWYVPTDEEVKSFLNLPAVVAGGEKGITADVYLKGLTDLRASEDLKLDEKFENLLKDQFNLVASPESKLVPLAQLGALVSQTYLATRDLLEQFTKILDRDGNGSVTVTEIIESHSDLERAFPDLFKRVKKQEEDRLRQQRADEEPMPAKKPVAAKKPAAAATAATAAAAPAATSAPAPAAGAGATVGAGAGATAAAAPTEEKKEEAKA